LSAVVDKYRNGVDLMNDDDDNDDGGDGDGDGDTAADFKWEV